MPADLDDKVQAGLKRLYDFQHADGGWGWWKADSTNRWMTAYVVYGLSLGARGGCAGRLRGARARPLVPDERSSARRSTTPSRHVWMVWPWRRAAPPPSPASTDFARPRQALAQGHGRCWRWRCRRPDDRRARIAVENLDDVVKAAAARADASVGEANDAWSTSAAIEATAYTLMAMAHYDLKSPALAPLTDFLVLRRNGGKWRTTRDTAFAVYALAELARREAAVLPGGQLRGEGERPRGEAARLRQGRRWSWRRWCSTDAALRPGKNAVEVQARRRAAPATARPPSTFTTRTTSSRAWAAT